jgi:hypothetical protein
MRFSLSQFICVAATGVMALGVQAQAPSTPGTPLDSDNSSARAEADYQAAVKACRATAGTEKASCLRDARDVRNRNSTSDGSSGSNASSSGGLGSTGGIGGSKPQPTSKQ